MASPPACSVLCGPTFLSGSGVTASQTADLFWIVIAAMLIVVVPVLLLTPLIAWRYRLQGTAAYTPRWDSSRVLEIIVWGVPVAIVACLGVVLWHATHRLDPYRPIPAAQPPLDVQVVGMDWKWVFLYPEQHIAMVNVLAVPAGRPLRLHLTSATVMQAFMVPQLGGQIYAMAGMTTQLNLLPPRPGSFIGENTQYNGDGFARQHFRLLAISQPAFDRLVTRAQGSPRRLDAARYRRLSMPGTLDAPLLLSGVQPGLFEAIVRRGATSSGASR